jgi:hypothetical protein
MPSEQVFPGEGIREDIGGLELPTMIREGWTSSVPTAGRWIECDSQYMKPKLFSIYFITLLITVLYYKAATIDHFF